MKYLGKKISKDFIVCDSNLLILGDTIYSYSQIELPVSSYKILKLRYKIETINEAYITIGAVTFFVAQDARKLKKYVK